MLSSAKIGTSSWRYYTDSVACAATEYYLGAGEAPGRWHGRGLDRLGLAPGALVTEAELEPLFARALHPVTGERLGRAWRADGVTGFDLTFSAPKSVSSLWALGDPAVAHAVCEAHRAATEVGLAYLDAHAGLSRRGTDGVEQIATGGFAVALFEHRTSRCADPQLHTHALVVNKVHCADGVWRTLDATELFHHKKSAGMVYQCALRNELRSRLGIEFGPRSTHGQAEILGVPDGLLKLWSKRTAQIDADALPKIAEYENALGRNLTAAERAIVIETAVLKTRPDKPADNPPSQHDVWIAEAQGAGFDPDRVVETVRAASFGGARPALGCGRLPAEAIAAAGTARAVFSRADVAGQVAARLPADGRSAADTLARIEELADAALGLADAVSLGRHPQGLTPRVSDPRWAAAYVLAAEARILSLADRGRAAGYGRVPAATLTASLAGAGLDPGQHEAVSRLAGGGDFLSVLTAPAGAGKTRPLGTAAAAWQQAGYCVIALAPSARAAAELAAATGTGTDTLAKWLHDHDRLGLLPADRRAAVVLDHRTVVILDEASMASTLDLATLTTTAARRAAKVVLVGDPAQIGVVQGPGGMLAALATAGHGVELTGIHRFAHAWEREASLKLRAGNPDALAAYAGQGRLRACGDSDSALDAVHAHWAALRADGVDALVMARARGDVGQLNARARAAALAIGEVHGPAVRLGERDWQAGDLLRTRCNDRRLAVGDGHVRNGDRYRVLQPHADGLLVEDLTERGRVVLPAAYVAAHAEYGWASTIDSAQGATTDVGIVLVRPGLDREHLYVAMTRGRDANHAYVTHDPTSDPEHHVAPVAGGRAGQTPDERALDVLATALAKSGAQDAATTARETARGRAADERRRAAERAVRDAAEPQIPAEHVATVARLAQARDEHARIGRDQQHLRRQLAEARDELAGTSRWSRSRRRELETAVARHGDALNATFPAHTRLGREIDELARQVACDSRQREDDVRARGRRVERVRSEPAVAELAPARPVRKDSASDSTGRTIERARRALQANPPEREVRRARQAHSHARDHGRDRDDGRSIGI